MPVLLATLERYHIAGINLLDRTALALHQAAAEGRDRCLTEWMRATIDG